MIKRELKYNFKSFFIWLVVTIAIFLVVFLVYPSIINSGNMDAISEMMQMFPKEILKAFNMDLATMDSAYGWLKTEGFVFVLLIIGSYAGILGSNILLKEESDKTIEYLNSLPIKRNKIVFSKVIVGIIYICLFVFFIGLFNFVGLLLSGDFDKGEYILLSITTLLPSFVLFFLCLFISTFTHKSKKMLSLGLGVVLVSYILQTLSTLDSSVEFLKYFSVFTLADVRNVIIDNSFNVFMFVISFVLSFGFMLLTVIRYNKKELV